MDPPPITISSNAGRYAPYCPPTPVVEDRVLHGRIECMTNMQVYPVPSLPINLSCHEYMEDILFSQVGVGFGSPYKKGKGHIDNTVTDFPLQAWGGGCPHKRVTGGIDNTVTDSVYIIQILHHNSPGIFHAPPPIKSINIITVVISHGHICRFSEYYLSDSQVSHSVDIQPFSYSKPVILKFRFV